jgi:hypothetical protein
LQVERKVVTKTQGRCEEIEPDPANGISERKRALLKDIIFLITGWKAVVRKESQFQRYNKANSRDTILHNISFSWQLNTNYSILAGKYVKME